MKRRLFLNQSVMLFAFAASGGAFACTRGKNRGKGSYVIKQFEDEGLAHFSYAIVVDKKIVLIDPARDPQPYYDYAKANNASIVAVIETHPHADFISSHVEIHQQEGATIYISKLAGATYPHEPFDEETHIELTDSIRLRAIHTPGHSPDSISVILEEAGEDIAVFTGDALLFGSVGRPDLREYSGEAVTARENLARQLYHTVHQKYAVLGDEVLVYPAHGAGSLCGNAIRDVKESTIGYEKAHNYAFEQRSEEAFVQLLLSDQPHIPAYFPYDVELNKQGVKALSTALQAVPLLEIADRDITGAIVVDTRDSEQFQLSHWPKSINIPDNSKFETWLGTVVSPDSNFYLIAESVADITRQLNKAAKIGYEALIAGAFVYGNRQEERYEAFNADSFDPTDDRHLILDVRTAKEFEEERVFENAINIPLAELNDKLQTLPTGKPIYVHCRSGYRSAIGSSLIKRALPASEVYDIGSSIKTYRK